MPCSTGILLWQQAQVLYYGSRQRYYSVAAGTWTEAAPATGSYPDWLSQEFTGLLYWPAAFSHIGAGSSCSLEISVLENSVTFYFAFSVISQPGTISHGHSVI